MQDVSEIQKICLRSAEELAVPMTLHIVLTTQERDALVWVTERSAFLAAGHGNFATVEKIRYLSDHQIAFSAWGDAAALTAFGSFSEYLEKRSVNLSNENDVKKVLWDFARGIPLPAARIGDPPATRGLLVATLGNTPRVYRVTIEHAPIVIQIYDQVHATAGDVENPANLFVRYYYPRCKRSVEELLVLGIHTIRLAKTLNSGGVGDPDVWVCRDGSFRQFERQQIDEYVKRSESLDAKILDYCSQ